ncbi:MAG: DUF115 domain-containing protein [Treponema sp.]|jgi:hypothetical protein|nr:DUF115 domain-containing protein [Treponema sp.]
MPGGNPVAMTEGKAPALHSRYNPQGEAERYIDALNPGGETGYFILIEPGRGYLVPVLQKRYPGAAMIALHLDPAFKPAAGETGVPAWFPGQEPGLQRFLEEHIPDTEARFVRIIEWRPGLRVYGERYLRLLEEAAEFIRRIDASARTARNFGRRWLRNFFKNLRLLDSPLKPEPFNRPLAITGAGPGLEEAIPRIRELKKARPLFVLAAASSLAALARGGIIPDLVFSADGGPWALRHLYECFRLPNRAGGPPPLAANLCAALPSQCAALPIMALNDGSLWQRIVLEGLNIPSLTVPQRGTVGAAALDLALSLSAGNIFIAGMDLAVRDLKTHARPYGFEPLFRGTATRFHPYYSQIFNRAGEIRRGGSYQIYAAWFEKQLAGWPGRIFSLGENNPVFRNLKTPAELPGADTAGTHAGRRIPAAAGPAELLGAGRRIPAAAGRGAEILIRALSVPALAETLIGELAPLLCPDRGKIPAGELGAEIQALARPYTEGRRG